MWFNWIGGWASHCLVAYLALIVGIIAGAWLSWYGDNLDQEQDGQHHPVGGHHPVEGQPCPWCGHPTREDHHA
jgi:hypothetical protein